MSTKIAIVTGSNKGIGYAIVKGLCQKYNGDVYLTSRDEQRGKQAVVELQKLGLQPKYHQLDINDKESIARFAKYIKSNYDGIDILINNAAIGFISEPVPTYEQARKVVETNYYGFVKACEVFLPLMKPNSRVINLGSNYGHLSNVKNKHLIESLTTTNITIEQTTKFVEDYLETVRNGSIKYEDFSENWTEYKVSKIAISLLTFIQHKQLQSKGIAVNVVHPGFVSTDLTKNTANLTWDEGAASSLYLALDAPQSLSGKFIWCDNSVVDWYDTSKDYCNFMDGIII